MSSRLQRPAAMGGLQPADDRGWLGTLPRPRRALPRPPPKTARRAPQDSEIARLPCDQTIDLEGGRASEAAEKVLFRPPRGQAEAYPTWHANDVQPHVGHASACRRTLSAA